jgi:integrase
MAGGVSKRRLQSGKVRWRYYGSYSGNKFYSSAKYLNEADALVARREHLERLATRGSHRMLLGDCIRQRIQDLELRHNNQRHTVQVEVQLQKFEDHFGANRELFDISRSEIQDLLDKEALRLKKEGCDNYSVNRLRTNLHALYQWAIDRWDLHARNPVSKIKKYPIEEKTKHIPQEWELELIEKKLQPKQRLLFLFVLQCGCRIGEALGLRAKDLDFEKRLVTLWSRKSKDNSLIYRKIPMPLVCDDIKISKNGNSRIFKSWKGTPAFLLKTIDRVNKKLDEVPDMSHWSPTWGKLKPITRFNWHNLRHACVSRMLTQGMPIYEVMVRVGHKNVMTTMAYAQLLGFTKFNLVDGYEVDPYDF